MSEIMIFVWSARSACYLRTKMCISFRVRSVAPLHAADELYEAAFVLQDARERQSTCVSITKSIVATRTKVLHAALVGFRASLGLAKPNARARVRQLAW